MHKFSPIRRHMRQYMCPFLRIDEPTESRRRREMTKQMTNHSLSKCLLNQWYELAIRPHKVRQFIAVCHIARLLPGLSIDTQRFRQSSISFGNKTVVGAFGRRLSRTSRIQCRSSTVDILLDTSTRTSQSYRGSTRFSFRTGRRRVTWESTRMVRQAGENQQRHWKFKVKEAHHDFRDFPQGAVQAPQTSL